MTSLTQQQKDFCQEELLEVIWANIEYDLRDILQEVSEGAGKTFEGLDGYEVFQYLQDKVEFSNLCLDINLD